MYYYFEKLLTEIVTLANQCVTYSIPLHMPTLNFKNNSSCLIKLSLKQELLVLCS